jgi:hypothetical protein
MDEPFFVLLLTIFYGITCGCIGAGLKARALKREMREQALLQQSAAPRVAAPEPARERVPPEVTARLTRVEEAIESMAGEMERISEGQRFTTKLLDRIAKERKPAALT